MAIYFPPLFCGQGTILKVLKEIEIEFEDGESSTISKGDKCIVDDIIGYGFDIKKIGQDKEFRILNSSMASYFEIINKVEPKFEVEVFGYEELEGNLVELKKDFVIENVVKIIAGLNLLHFQDFRSKGLYHDLFSTKNNEKVLRMKDREFEEYFK